MQNNKSQWLLVLYLAGIMSAATAAAAEKASPFATDLKGLVPKKAVNSIDERELLKRYLKEVRKRSDLESRNELAKIALQRDIFGAYNQRWWQNYSDEERENKVNRYWDFYNQGEEQAQNIMSQSAGINGCRLLRTYMSTDAVPTPPSDEPEVADAFRRGMVSAYPACFIENLLDQIKAFDGQVEAIHDKLYEFQKKVTLHKPDEQEIQAISEGIRDSYRAAIDTFVTGQIPELKTVVKADATSVQSIQRLTGVIAKQMDCDHLTDRRGRQMNCIISSVPGAYPVDLSAAYKILFQGQKLGVYQESLRLDSFFEAVEVYLREVRPGDIIVTELFAQLKGVLARADNQDEARYQNFLVRYRDIKETTDQAAVLANRSLWRDYFPDDQREQLIDMFSAIKEEIEGYRRLDLATQLEQTTLDMVIAHYDDTLALAASIYLHVPVPSLPVNVDLPDETGTRVCIGQSPTDIPAGFLLGVTGEDVRYWVDQLVIESSDSE